MNHPFVRVYNEAVRLGRVIPGRKLRSADMTNNLEGRGREPDSDGARIRRSPVILLGPWLVLPAGVLGLHLLLGRGPTEPPPLAPDEAVVILINTASFDRAKTRFRGLPPQARASAAGPKSAGEPSAEEAGAAIEARRPKRIAHWMAR